MIYLDTIKHMDRHSLRLPFPPLPCPTSFLSFLLSIPCDQTQLDWALKRRNELPNLDEPLLQQAFFAVAWVVSTRRHHESRCRLKYTTLWDYGTTLPPCPAGKRSNPALQAAATPTPWRYSTARGPAFRHRRSTFHTVERRPPLDIRPRHAKVHRRLLHVGRGPALTHHLH